MANLDQFAHLHIGQLDDYIDLLYADSIEQKINGAKCFLYLTLSAENMEVMVQHDTLFGLCSRTLKEEFKKSTELSLYLLYAFYAYSSFPEFHTYLLENVIGATTMKIIRYQLERYEIRKEDVDEKRAKAKKMDPNMSIEQQEETRKAFESEEKKFNKLVKKHERVLYVSYRILLNLAENLQIERKMKKQNITEDLVGILDRNNVDLLLVTINFLKKLSIFAENKNEMIEMGVIEKLARFLPCNNQLLMSYALRLLYNLSFDQRVREIIISNSMIPRIIDLLKIPSFTAIILKIAYNISVDDRAKATFFYTECLPLVYNLIVHFPEPQLSSELVALAVNLTTNANNAEYLGQGDQMNQLIKRSLKFRDTLLLKVVKNVAQNGKTVQDALEMFCGEFIRQCLMSDDSDFTVELLGIIGYIKMDSWVELVQGNNFLEFLAQNMVIGTIEDDVVLESVMVLSQISADPDCIDLISQTNIIALLNNLLTEKQEDDEIVQQILYVYYRLLLFDRTADIIFNHTQIISYIIELLKDPNEQIKKMAENILSLVQEMDPDWSFEIKARRFQLHNFEWLQGMEQYEGNMADERFNDEDYGYYYDGSDDELVGSDDDDQFAFNFLDGGNLQDRHWVEEEEEYEGVLG